MGKLIIDGNQVYELDEACMKQKEEEQKLLERKNKRKERHEVWDSKMRNR